MVHVNDGGHYLQRFLFFTLYKTGYWNATAFATIITNLIKVSLISLLVIPIIKIVDRPGPRAIRGKIAL